MSSLPHKVVVVAPNWLGDAVMSLPLLGMLSGIEDVTLSVMTKPYVARVYRGLDGVDELMTLGGGGRWGRIRTQARALRAVGADAVVILPPSFSSALPPWLARTRLRVGYTGDGRDALLTQALDLPPRGSEHLARSYVALGRRVLECLALTPPAEERAAPAPRVFAVDRDEARALLAERAIVPGDYAVIVPGATYGPAKSWPRERFREAAQALGAEVPVVLAGGPDERDLCREIAHGLSGVHSVAGETSLGGLFALLSESRVLLANDSGTPHVAAALGVPAVVLFGSTSPEWTRPLGDVTVIRHPVHCSPCFKRTCPTHLECFDGISVDEVVAATRAAMGRRPAPKKGVA